jgi:hypothetical protein
METVRSERTHCLHAIPQRPLRQFLRERVYLHNITPKTREFYETAWKAFVRSQAGAPCRPAPGAVITRADVRGFVIHL